MISVAGGSAVALRVDHTVEEEVEALFQRVERERGRLDVLVNQHRRRRSIDGTVVLFLEDGSQECGGSPPAVAPVPHHHSQACGSLYDSQPPRAYCGGDGNEVLSAGGNPVTQTVKFALKGLALNMAAELRPHGVAAVAVTPGFLRSETMLERFGVTEETWREGGKKDRSFLESESPLFVGRAVVALAGDPAILERSGQLFSSWELGREYRFMDTDGRRPDWGASKIDFSKHPEQLLQLPRTGSQIQLRWLSELRRKTKRFLAQLSQRKTG